MTVVAEPGTTQTDPDPPTVADARPVRELIRDDAAELGWRFVVDRTRRETADQRRARYMADHRLVDLKGFAAIILRSYALVKDLHHDAEAQRAIVRANQVDEDYYRSLQADVDRLETAGAPAATLGPLRRELNTLTARRRRLRAAEDELLKALPPRRERGGRSPLWWAADAFRTGRRIGWVDEWYEKAVIKQTGRPPDAT